MDSTFEGCNTPSGTLHRIPSDPASARSAEYESESDLKTNDSSEEFIDSRDYQLIGGRSSRQRRKILKAKRRIFSTSSKSADEKKSLIVGHLASVRNLHVSSYESIQKVEQWVAKHRKEFEKCRTVAQGLPLSNEESSQSIEITSLAPTHEMVWVNALLPVQINEQINYINKLIPLLVPKGTVAKPAIIERFKQPTCQQSKF